MTRPSAIRILYIDDEEHNLQSFKASFRREYEIYTAISAEAGLKILKNVDIHIILADQKMPKTTGVEFFQSIAKTHPDPMRILMTGYTDIDALADAINHGDVYRYIQKPWMEEDLRINIEKAIEIYNLRKENRELTEKLLVANRQLEFIARQSLLS